jgi:fumarylacetoacetate (FAA) hydrolase
MKLATFDDGSRDGQLMVVSRDLSLAHFATGLARTLQQVLDDWNFLSPQLENLAQQLNAGRAPRAFGFEPRHCLAPMPRAFQVAAGFAYPSHVSRLRRDGQWAGDARAAAGDKPLLALAAGEPLLGPHADAHVAQDGWDVDCAAQLAAITGDVRAGARADEALDGVRLLTLSCDWLLRTRLASEAPRGGGIVQSRLGWSFAPVALTPDELGAAWHGGRLHAQVTLQRNGELLGRCDSGDEMGFHFGQLIAHLARTRSLRAGAIVGSGPISNEDATRGACCVAERRALDAAAASAERTPFLRFGDRVRVDATAADGRSLFGVIEQRLASWRGAAAAESA